MDINAGSPVIFIPMSNYSDILIVADLGSLCLTNKFLWSGSPDTISQVRAGFFIIFCSITVAFLMSLLFYYHHFLQCHISHFIAFIY